jgi:hypothetical protein
LKKRLSWKNKAKGRRKKAQEEKREMKRNKKVKKTRKGGPPATATAFPVSKHCFKNVPSRD